MAQADRIGSHLGSHGTRHYPLVGLKYGTILLAVENDGLILTELFGRYVVVGDVALDVLANEGAHVIRCGELLAYGTYLLLDSKHVIIRGVDLEYDIRDRAVGLLRI